MNGLPNRAARRAAERNPAPLHVHGERTHTPEDLEGDVTITRLVARILLDLVSTPEVVALLVGSQQKLQIGLAQQELERVLSTPAPTAPSLEESTDDDPPDPTA